MRKAMNSNDANIVFYRKISDIKMDTKKYENYIMIKTVTFDNIRLR